MSPLATHLLALNRSAGFTLIEAVAALAICSAVVVALLAARGRLLRQAEHAERIATANVVAGRMAAQWQLGQLPVSIGERLGGHDDASAMRWELACKQAQTPDGAFLTRLDIDVYGQEQDRPLVSLEAWRSLGAGGRYDH